MDELLLNWVKVAIHPTWSTLPIATHVVIELLSQRRMGIQIPKHIELRPECVLVRSVCDIGSEFVIVLLQIL